MTLKLKTVFVFNRGVYFLMAEVYMYKCVPDFAYKTHIKNLEMNADSGRVTVKDISLDVLARFAILLDTVVIAYR